jgi:hypothetical protein
MEKTTIKNFNLLEESIPYYKNSIANKMLLNFDQGDTVEIFINNESRSGILFMHQESQALLYLNDKLYLNEKNRNNKLEDKYLEDIYGVFMCVTTDLEPYNTFKVVTTKMVLTEKSIIRAVKKEEEAYNIYVKNIKDMKETREFFKFLNEALENNQTRY